MNFVEKAPTSIDAVNIGQMHTGSAVPAWYQKLIDEGRVNRNDSITLIRDHTGQPKEFVDSDFLVLRDGKLYHMTQAEFFTKYEVKE